MGSAVAGRREVISVWLAALVFAAFWSIVCAILADRKGRNPAAWAILGFFFGVFALVVLSVLRDTHNRYGP